jgi:cytochrome-b5 reductase
LVAGRLYYYYNQGNNTAKAKNTIKNAEAKAKKAVGQGKAAKAAFTSSD